MSFRTKFKTALEAGSRSAVIKALVAHPNATVAELRKLSHADPILARMFKSITIADLFKGDGVVTGRKRAKASTTVRRYGSTTRVKRDRLQVEFTAIDTRTPEGRAAYDEALLKAVKSAKAPIGAGMIIAEVGGTPLQARSGLARLIADEKITWTGKARGTKYEAL